MKTKISLFPSLIITAIHILLPFAVSAQSPSNYHNWEDMLNTVAGRQVVSPQAASFQKLGSYPVNKATGIPDVSIPIYTIRSGELEFPISLSYHMGGIKVDEIPSWVGLGWNLSAGGVISRVIRGLPDEEDDGGWLEYNTPPYSYNNFTGYLNNNNAVSVISYYERLKLNVFDRASDIYTYSIGGVSGKFVYDFDQSMVQIPYTDNKITRNGNDFTIIDDKGIKYVFKESDSEKGYVRTPMHMGGEMMVPVSWNLSEIVSADGRSSIKFNYNPTTTTYEEIYFRESIVRGKKWRVGASMVGPGGSVTIGPPSLEINESVEFIATHPYERNEERLLNSIDFRGGKIEFIPTSRSDRTPMRYLVGNGTAQRLSEMKVYAGEVQVKRIVLNHNYVNGPRLNLTGINVYGKIGSNAETYSFKYNTTPALPSYHQNSQNFIACYAQDYWGYYNGASSNSSLIPLPALPTTLHDHGANRESNEYWMKAGILTQINYPTGGYTTFATEANRVIENGVNRVVGGLRISEIRSYADSNDSNPLIVSFNYENGKLIYFPTFEFHKMSMRYSSIGGFHPGDNVFNRETRATMYMADPIWPTGAYQGSPVIYSKVTEIKGGTSVPGGKTVYEYDEPSSYHGALIRPNPTIPIGEAASPTNWQNGHLKKRIEYKKEGNTYVKVKEVENKYSDYWSMVCHGTLLFDKVIAQGVDLSPTGIPSGENESGHFALQFFCHYWTCEKSGYRLLSETIEKEFTSATDTIGIGTRITYTYGNAMLLGQNKNYLPSQITVHELSGQSQLKQTDYVYAHKGGLASNTMYSKNMLNYPHEEMIKGPDGNIYFRSRIEYSNTMLKPEKMWKSFSSTLSDAVPDLTIVNRDSYGNTREVKDRNGVSTVYLWSYNGQHLIAEIVNATYQQVNTILSTSFIDQLLTTSKPTTPQLSTLNSLRNHTSMSTALVITYEFDPLVGMTKITDPSGRSTFYDYDAFGRLKSVTDDAGNPVENYQYHYKFQ